MRNRRDLDCHNEKCFSPGVQGPIFHLGNEFSSLGFVHFPLSEK